MPRNSGGTYSLPAGNPVVTGEIISSAWANTTLTDIGTAITASLSRAGEGGMLAPLSLFSGTAGFPGLTWTAESTSGWYRAGLNDFRWVIAGVDRVTLTTAGATFAGNVTAASFTGPLTSGNFANPSASLGLAAVNGSAVTAMRSDAAPALSQAIAPTWTGSHIFTSSGIGATPAIRLQSASPWIAFRETDQAAGAQDWLVGNSGGSFLIVSSIDGSALDNVVFNATRTGSAVSNITFGNPANSPSYTFSGSGVVTTGGVIRGPLGSVTAPTYSFSGLTGAGMFASGDGTLRFATNGVHSFILDSINSRNISYHSLQVVPDGTAALPAVTFINDTNTGIYLDSPDSLSVTAGGVNIVLIRGAGLLVGTGRIFNQDGSVGNPAYTFLNDQDTGFWRAASDTIGLSTGGVTRLGISTIVATFTVPTEAPSFTTTSSRAVKRETGSPSKASNILSRLRPILYRMLEGDDKEQLGLIAEEVHEVCPQLSNGKTVAYDRLALLLLSAWQEERVA